MGQQDYYNNEIENNAYLREGKGNSVKPKILLVCHVVKNSPSIKAMLYSQLNSKLIKQVGILPVCYNSVLIVILPRDRLSSVSNKEKKVH